MGDCRNKHTSKVIGTVLLGGQRPLVPLLLLGPPFFLINSFWVYHLVNREDAVSLHMQRLLTSQLHVSVSQIEHFLLRIKLHALIRLGVSAPSFDTGAQNGVLCGSCESH
jgi:hypothetical protein